MREDYEASAPVLCRPLLTEQQPDLFSRMRSLKGIFGVLRCKLLHALNCCSRLNLYCIDNTRYILEELRRFGSSIALSLNQKCRVGGASHEDFALVRNSRLCWRHSGLCWIVSVN